MKTGRSRTKKAAVRTAAKGARMSTSQARANFKKSLEQAHLKNAIIGFERYGALVAALVPIDGVRMIAGRGKEAPAAVREQLERTAQLFLADAPVSVRGEAAARPKKSAAKKAAKKTAAPAKAARKAAKKKKKGLGKSA